MKPITIIFIVILTAYLVPTFNIGGIPIRIEDILFIFILLVYQKNSSNSNNKIIYIVLFLILFFNILSAYAQILSGYVPVLGDLNSIFSLTRNIFIFYVGQLIGRRLKADPRTLIVVLSLGFVISSVASLIQYYDIGGIGEELFLLYGKQNDLEFGLNRVVGTIGNPNYAAFFQINAFITFLVLNPTKPLNKYFRLFLLSAIVISVFVTFSRTGLVGIILLFLIKLLIEKRILMLAILLFLFAISIPTIANLSQKSRFESLVVFNDNIAGSDVMSLNGRIDRIWVQKLEVFLSNPLIGISSAKGLKSNTEFDVVTYDNSFLFILVTGGLIGLFLHLFLYYKIIGIFCSKRSIKQDILAKYLIFIHINIAIFFLTTDLITMVEFTTFYFFSMGIILNFNEENETISLNSNIKLEQS